MDQGTSNLPDSFENSYLYNKVKSMRVPLARPGSFLFEEHVVMTESQMPTFGVNTALVHEHRPFPLAFLI